MCYNEVQNERQTPLSPAKGGGMAGLSLMRIAYHKKGGSALTRRVLLVDDDLELLVANQEYFEDRGYQVFCANTGEKALKVMEDVRLDCVVLDIDLPGRDGFTVCQYAREFTNVPIIFLSAYTEEESRVNGLLVGGDDYVCKPFSLRELELRVKVRIRSWHGERAPAVLQYGQLTIDIGSRRVSYGDKTGDFSRIEFDLLAFLAKNPNQIFSYEQLYDGVWKEPLGESRHNLQARMASMRQKLCILCPDKDYLQTVRHKGYQFVP